MKLTYTPPGVFIAGKYFFFRGRQFPLSPGIASVFRLHVLYNVGVNGGEKIAARQKITIEHGNIFWRW